MNIAAKTSHRAEWLPLLPLRQGILSPGEVCPLFVGTPASVVAVRMGFAEGGCLILATLREPDGEMSAPESTFRVGVQAAAIQLLEADGHIRVMVEVTDRVRLQGFSLQDQGFYRVKTEPWPDVPSNEIEVRGLARLAFERFDTLRQKMGLPEEANKLLAAAVGEKFLRLPWAALHYLDPGLESRWISHQQRQELLEAFSLSERLRMLIELLDRAEPPLS